MAEKTITQLLDDYRDASYHTGFYTATLERLPAGVDRRTYEQQRDYFVERRIAARKGLEERMAP
jgi:hypothetical protein